MKKITILITLLIFIITLSACEDSETYTENSDLTLIDEVNLDESTDLNLIDETIDDEYLDSPEYSEVWGSVSALNSESFTIEEMLVYAIQDEYSAYAEYDYILDNFDVTRPFSNIITAEAHHIEMLLPLFESYEIEVPYNDAESHLLPVIDLEDTFRTGVIAEILNIDMYDLFLEQDLPDDIRDTFIALRDASIKHLSAFENNLSKYE